MEKPIKELLVTVKQRIQFMGKREYHMKVWGIDHFCPAIVHPDFFLYGLAVGAVAVTAGIVMKFHMSTVGTLADVTNEAAGFAVHDGRCCFFLYA